MRNIKVALASAAACLGVLVLAAPVMAQSHLAGTDRFPQFRGLSGLGCSGYGLDADGRMSLDGPVAFSIPVAHTLGHNQVRIGRSVISGNHNAPKVFSSGETNGNATGMITAGITLGTFNVMASDLFLSSKGDQVFCAQVQALPREGEKIIWAIGCQDMRGGGGSSGTGVAGDDRRSRSLYGTITTPVGNPDRPMYLTAGLGTRRFKNGFAGASYKVARPVRLFAEYDSFGGNVGMVVSGVIRNYSRPIETALTVALVDGRYPTISTGIGF